ncbi:MAG: 4-hydroxy-tetrahydrodipicolinate synthase [Candidatus Eremiobacteraeota bacterium]|nr:4-hydroxy-tetrahydrodipicolinate synthase [Candidatus Eremiobacteraeota bacterium]
MTSIGRAPKIGPLLTAMLTPFAASGAVDLREAGRLARWLIDQGNQGLVVAGTTGESPALDDDEKIELFAAVKEAVGERGAVVANTGGNNTHHSVELTKRAEAAGVDGILAVVPYYNKPPQDGMLRHFGAVAEATRLPVILYNIPGRTGANMLPATLLELAKRHRNVAGVKESSGDLAQFTEILRDRPEGFGFWCGDDHLFLPSLAVGGDGLIGVASHLCARELRAMLDAHTNGEPAKAARIHQELSDLFATLFAITSPIPIKWAMNQLGFACGPCRSPLGDMPEALAATLAPQLEAYRARVSEGTLAAI